MPDNPLLQNETNSLELPFVKSHAFLIGIDAYEHIKPLRTAVKDASDIAELLADEEKHAYQVHLFTDTTKAMMEECFSLMQTLVQAEDRVLFYFAGHGIALDSEVDPEGYLVPADAKADDKDSLVKMDRLHEVLTALPCKHGLLVLDCCFAGSFKWSTDTRAEIFDFGQTLYAERFWRYVQHPAWQVITSSAHDQKAADLLDHQALGLREEELTDTQNSPFAWAFKQAIDLHSKADTQGLRKSDGVVTTTELFLFLRETVLTASQNAQRQSPALFTLGKKHDSKGEFIFLNPGHPLNLEKTPSKNPYKGLMPYRQDDASIFFGRKAAILDLAKKLEKTSILIVSAPSGQGKSSVVQAGLLPYLQKESAYEAIHLIRPSDNPYKQLKALPKLKAQTRSILVIDQYEEFFTDADYGDSHNKFEDYLIKLYQSIGDTLDGLKIIITIRSDFEWELQGSRFGQSFWQGVNIRQFLYRLPPMGLEELRQILETPLWVNAYDFESEEMVDQILEEINYAPGALALLSFTMQQLYLLRDTSKRMITAQSYTDQLGGVNGALSKHADKIFKNMPSDEHRMIMQNLMLRMVRLNDGSYSRRRVYIQLKTGEEGLYMNELDYLDHLDQKVAEVIEIFVDQHLIIQNQDDSGIYIEPIHDSLINYWPRCLTWIQAFGRENLLLQRQLWAGVLEWKMPAKPTDQKATNLIGQTVHEQGLWDTHPKLAQVIQSVIEGVDTVVLKDGKSILWRELKSLTTQLKAKEKKQVEYLLDQWRDKGIVPQLESFIYSGVSSALFEIILSEHEHWLNQAEVDFVKESWKAKILEVIQLKKERDEARALVLSMTGKSFLKENPILGLKLLKTSYEKVLDNPPAQLIQNIVDAFYGQLKKMPKKSILKTTDQPITQTLFSVYGRNSLTFLKDGTVQYWNPSNKLINTWPKKVPILQASILPKSKAILILTLENTIQTWSLEGVLLKDYSSEIGKLSSYHLAEEVQSVLIVNLEKVARIYNLKEEKWEAFEEKNVDIAALSPKAQSVFISFEHSSYIRVLAKEHPSYLGGDHNESQGKYINDAIFSANGQSLLTGESGGRAVVWSLNGVPNLDAIIVEEAIVEVQFGPGMDYYLGIARPKTEGDDKRVVYVWSKEHELISRISAADGSIEAAYFYDYNHIVILSSQGSLQIWNVQGEALGIATTRKPIRSLYVLPQDQEIITQNGDREISRWELDFFQECDLIRKPRLNIKKPLLSPEETHHLSLHDEKTILLTRLSDGDTQKISFQFKIHKFQFSSDGKLFLVNSGFRQNPNPNTIWNLQGEGVKHLQGILDTSSYVCFAPALSYLLSISKDSKNLQIWTFEGKSVTYINNSRGFLSVDFSPNADFFLTTQKEGGPAQLWSINGDLIANIGQNVEGVFFTNEGESIYFADLIQDDIMPHLWPSPQRIKRLLFEDLELPNWTEAEATQFGI